MEGTEKLVPGSKHVAPTSRGSSAYPRKRAVTACQVCRARRTRCDQKKPACSFCANIGAECVFDISGPSTFDPASLAIIDRLERLERKLDAQATQSAGSSPYSSQQSPRDAATYQSATAAQATNLDAVLAWPIFRTLGCPASPSSVISPQAAPSSRLPPLREPGLGIGDDLDAASCGRWVDSFFCNVHTKNPVLDEERTRRLVRDMCIEGPGYDSSSCLALLVCANGALVRPFEAPSLTYQDLGSSEAMSIFALAQKRLGHVLVATGLVEAQCALFTGVFLMSILRPADAWRMFLHGLAICQSFPSIRNPVSFADEARRTADVVAEESIHWSCWKSEHEVRLELDRSNVGNLAYDPPRLFPSPPTGCDERAWYFYLSEISLWRLQAGAEKEMVAMMQESLRSSPGANAGLSILGQLRELGESMEEQMSAWRRSLPPSLAMHNNDTPATAEEDDVLFFCLRGRCVYIQELVTWPFLHAMINEGVDSPAIREGVGRGLRAHLDRMIVYSTGYYHRHHGTWLSLRSSTKSACILLAFSRLPAARHLMPDGWERRVRAVMEMMIHYRDEAPGMDQAVEVAQYLLSLP
ncbi:hypothetical protein B0T11DRAFT_227288 [Plectosphaerella cucumerina]|uniref:Zn(2)-C6 fungal-type domain-containing protein n=1 Tax=Plectosphaerella cucumerina TaxID=40658 RepID=A0A8K0TJT3_9PEZI|nr:hypothetical protein B0T11DRAFT_227288 [Plectosphaerella cucumerina]